jgi:hypothetical protein
MYLEYNTYNCDVVLDFWFWQEIVIDVTYILSVQYSCAVVSVFWLWQEIVLKKGNTFLQKKHIGLLYYDPIANVCIYDQTLFYSVSFYFVYFSCTAQICTLKFKSEYYLRTKIRNRVKNANTCNHTSISWKMIIPFLYFWETTRKPKYLSVTVCCFLALYGSTTIQSQLLLKKSRTIFDFQNNTYRIFYFRETAH